MKNPAGIKASEALGIKDIELFDKCCNSIGDTLARIIPKSATTNTVDAIRIIIEESAKYVRNTTFGDVENLELSKKEITCAYLSFIVPELSLVLFEYCNSDGSINEDTLNEIINHINKKSI